MKKAIFVIMYSCLSCALNAQFTVEWAFSKASYSTVPFNFYKDCSFEQTYTIENPGYIMPDRLYQNFQLTEYFLARENLEATSALRMKFKLKNLQKEGDVDIAIHQVKIQKFIYMILLDTITLIKFNRGA